MWFCIFVSFAKINSELSEKQEEEEKKDAYTIQKQLWQLCFNSYEVM